MTPIERKRIEKSGGKVLRAVQPNAGIEADYRRKLLALVDEMAKSTAWWLRAAYRKDPPRMAQDSLPARELKAAIEQLTRRWQDRFDAAAPKLAAYFAQSVAARSDKALAKILRDGGISVKFRMSAAMRDVMAATVESNVALIKSIPQEFHTQVQGIVMRSVQAGRDLKPMVRDLQKQFGVTRRRAEFISLDQSNKATSALQRARQVELGIEDGVWQHSHAGREPRPTHLANDGKKFSVAEGWFDPDPKVRERIWPGQLPRCRCTWRPVVKGFS